MFTRLVKIYFKFASRTEFAEKISFPIWLLDRQLQIVRASLKIISNLKVKKMKTVFNTLLAFAILVGGLAARKLIYRKKSLSFYSHFWFDYFLSFLTFTNRAKRPLRIWMATWRCRFRNLGYHKQLRFAFGILHRNWRFESISNRLSTRKCVKHDNDGSGSFSTRYSIPILIRMYLPWTDAAKWCLAFIPLDKRSSRIPIVCDFNSR